MKWETVSSTLGHSVYALWNNGRKLATLVFNFSSNAARIEYADEKRVFLLRKEGFLKNKTVLRNEYGIRVGYTGTENNEDYLMLNDERFFYTVDNTDKEHEPTVTIYKESKNNPIAVCGLDIEDGNHSLGSISKNKFFRDDALYSMLMTLCLYLFQPVKKEKQLEYSLG